VNNEILLVIIALVISYLAGSISFSRLVTKLVSPDTNLESTKVPVEDLNEEVSMNAISATSVRFQLGPKYGLLSSFLDMVKVAIPVAFFHFLFPDSSAEFFAATGGIIGHNWPVYYNFKGGYGHSPIYGALLVIEWTAVPISFFGTAILYFIFRQVHFAAFGGILLIIPWLWYLDYEIYALLYASICSLAYFIKILPDFQTVRELEKRSSKLENQKKMNNFGDE